MMIYHDDEETIGKMTENARIIAAIKMNIADMVKRRLSYELVCRRRLRNLDLPLSVILATTDLRMKFNLRVNFNEQKEKLT